MSASSDYYASGSAPVESRDPRLHRVLLLFGLFCLLLPLPFIWLHLTTPSDGARLAREPVIFSERGAVVSPYAATSSVLREGDTVTAVDGIQIETWMAGLLRSRLNHPNWQVGQTVKYTVLRGGKLTEINVLLGPLPWGAILRDHWSVIVFFLASQLVAGFVYAQRREDPAARAFFIWAFCGSHTYTWAFFLQVSDLLNPLSFWLFHLAATGLWLVFWAAVVHMVLVFPKPLIHPKNPGRWLLLLYLSPFLLFGLFLSLQWVSTRNLLVWWDRWGTGQTLVAALYTLPALVVIVLQYFTSRSEVERIKTRWVIFGTLVSLGLGLVFYFIPSLLGKTFISANALGLINFPFIITMAIAIWRYRLFDIDLIIRRTLQYSLLTGLLSLVYFSGVALLQAALTADLGGLGGAVSSESAQPPALVIVLTTLAVAALFNPLRHRVQDFIDRRFYRQKYDAEQALAEFAAFTRSETDINQITEDLTGLVRETLKPVHTSLWLCHSLSKSRQAED